MTDECKGDWNLGTACQHCAKCKATMPRPVGHVGGRFAVLADQLDGWHVFKIETTVGGFVSGYRVWPRLASTERVRSAFCVALHETKEDAMAAIATAQAVEKVWREALGMFEQLKISFETAMRSKVVEAAQRKP